ALERRGVRRLHLEQQRVLAGHVVALEHVAERGHLALEVTDPARVRDQHPDESGDVEAEPARVQDGAVAGHDAGGLELLDALEHRGGAQTHLLSDANERRPAVRGPDPPRVAPPGRGPSTPSRTTRCPSQARGTIPRCSRWESTCRALSSTGWVWVRRVSSGSRGGS